MIIDGEIVCWFVNKKLFELQINIKKMSSNFIEFINQRQNTIETNRMNKMVS